MTTSTPIYSRVLIKLSGEALMNDQSFGIDGEFINKLSKSIVKVQDMGVEVGIVIGGGNFLRGGTLQNTGMKRTAGDQMGMLATIMNSIAFKDALESNGAKAEILNSTNLPSICGTFNYSEADKLLKNNNIVIFSGGTGNPFFTTDTAACLRAIEIQADVVFKATKVDGVFDKDPSQHNDAKMYTSLSYKEVIDQRLKVMDLTAVILCEEHNMKLRVLNMTDGNAIVDAMLNEQNGTVVS